ncbi:hypothetical protein AB0J40_28780 [Amycolatopsis sp. NPDC049691]|uniref:hypothetical protein n=1 Tax=Amycolatopsis sp. NPDC049691 TaxID=3155155 RepID=UPI00341C84D2
MRQVILGIDAISCSVPLSRLTADQQTRIVTVMREIQLKIETLLAPGAPDWR